MPAPLSYLGFFTVINLLGIIQGLFMALVIYFYPKGNKKSNIFLAAFIGTLSVYLFTPILQLIYGVQNLKISCLIDPLIFLFGPLLYFYIRSFTERLTLRDMAPHLLLFPLYAVFLYVYLANYRVPTPEEFTPLSFSFIFFSLLKFSHLFLYFYLSWKALRRHATLVEESFSEVSDISLQWTRQLLFGFLAIVAVALVLQFLLVLYPEYNMQFSYLILALITPYIYFASYKGITQPAIFRAAPATPAVPPAKQQVDGPGWASSPGVAVNVAQETEPSEAKVKYERSGLSEEKAEEVLEAVLNGMEEEKLYLDSDITMQLFSERLQLPSHYVSQVINDRLHKNFFEFVNHYRVEEAKRLLSDPTLHHYTILAIAFDAGFNSKTTFNTVFKKYTGTTPSKFRENPLEMA